MSIEVVSRYIFLEPNANSVITIKDLEYFGYPKVNELWAIIRNGGLLNFDYFGFSSRQRRNLRLAMEGNNIGPLGWE